jgi:putative MATE family efflux protein
MGAAIAIVAAPVLLQQSMAALLGLVDTILAGRLDPQVAVPALDAVSIGSYATWFIGIAMTGLGIGGQALIARAMGAGDRGETHRALGQAIALSGLWGGMIGLLLWAGARPMGIACRLGPQAIDLLALYVRIIACSLPAAGVMLVGSMCMHGAGETMLPSLIAVLTNVVNIAVSWALCGVDIGIGGGTLVNPFPFDLGLAGIALGTAAAYGAGGLLTLWGLRGGVRDLRLRAGDLRMDRSMTRRIVRVGVPGFLDSFMMWSANLFVLLIIGSIAASEVSSGVPREGLQGAHLIAIRWEAFSFLPGFAMGTAAGALAGQYLGAQNPRMAQRSILVCTGIACVLMGLLGLLFMTGGRALTRIISAEPVHLELAPRLLFVCGTVQVFFAITLVVRQGLRGTGDTTWMFLITTVSSWGVRLPAAWLLGVGLELGLVGVWYGLCGEIVVRGALASARVVHGGWKHIIV